MKRIIRSSTELQARQYTADYLSRQDKRSYAPLDDTTKHLIRKYAEDIIAPSRNSLSFIRQAGPGLLEYLMERIDITRAMIPSIFNYFVKCDNKVVAGGRK